MSTLSAPAFFCSFFFESAGRPKDELVSTIVKDKTSPTINKPPSLSIRFLGIFALSRIMFPFDVFERDERYDDLTSTII